jgi:hypothetical protein
MGKIWSNWVLAIFGGNEISAIFHVSEHAKNTYSKSSILAFWPFWPKIDILTQAVEIVDICQILRVFSTFF